MTCSLHVPSPAPVAKAARYSHVKPRPRRAAAARVYCMAAKDVPAVVSPQWLAERLSDPGVKVLDASWYLPAMGKDAVADFASARVPGAAFFDIDGVALPGSALPHMLPTPAQFAAAMDALGVTNETTVVAYDGMGLFSSPRVWWTFRAFGHDKVAVLEGGLPAWKEAGLPLEGGPPGAAELGAPAAAVQAVAAGQAPPPFYVATLQTDKVRDVDQMLKLVGGRCAEEQVVDARPAGRFAGADPEPRASLRGGHMPGARSVPFAQVYEGGKMQAAKLLPPAELAAVFQAAGVDLARPVVASCGSGLTACILSLALYQATGQVAAVYDGSWTEWGSREDAPIEGGAA